MKSDIKLILPECLELIQHGASVDDCLQKYPEHASELRDLLAVAQLTKSYLQRPLTPNTEMRIHQKVVTGLARDDLAGQRAKPAGWWLPRWATVVASVVLFVFVSGAGIVSVAAGTVPGDTLYPVKTSTEHLQLSLTTSEAAKSRVHIRLAEKRIDEILRVLPSNHPEMVAGLSTQAKFHIEQSELYLSRDFKGKASAIDTLESSALGQLSNLEEVRPKVSGEVRVILDDVLRTSGAAYGNAIETVSSGDTTSPVTESGTVRVYLGDHFPEGLADVRVEISGLEVYLTGPESGWITIVGEPLFIDITDRLEAKFLVEETMVGIGSYTKLRLGIAGIAYTTGEGQAILYEPGEELILTRPFKVSGDETVDLILDLDWEHLVGSFDTEPSERPLSGMLLVPPTPSGPPDDKEPGPPDDKEPGPPDDKEPGPPDDKEPGPPDDKEPGPPDDKEPGPPDDKD
jgi:hypothetical protein